MSIAKLIDTLSLIRHRDTSGVGRSLFLVKIMRSLFPTFRNAGVMPDLRFQFYRMQFFRIRRAALITQSRIDYVNKRYQTYEWHVPYPSHIDFPLSSIGIQYAYTFAVLQVLDHTHMRMCTIRITVRKRDAMLIVGSESLMRLISGLILFTVKILTWTERSCEIKISPRLFI